MMLTYKTIQEYPHYTVVDAYDNGIKLYRTAINKEPPTEAENYRMIQKLDTPIVVTDEEKVKTTSGRKKLTDEQMKVIKADMKNKAYTAAEIKKRHNISDKTYKKIKNTVLEKFVIDRQDYGLDN